MDESTALVTGAHGFLGRHVAKRLAAAGYFVQGVGHGAWARGEQREWGIGEWHACDVTLETLLTYGREPEVVVHCAGSASVGFSMRQPLQDFRRTVDSTAAVLEYVRNRVPSAAVVLPSSGSVYGSVDSGLIGEAFETNPRSAYATHKLMAEQLCREYAEHFALRVAIIRLFSLYGPGLRKQLLWDACRKLSRGGATFFGTGAETRDFLHVEDAASLVEFAANSADKTCLLINGGTGIGASVRNILDALISVMGEGEIKLRFDGVEQPGTPARFVADTSRALSLGWEPKIRWQDGVPAYARWFAKEAP